jgi:hypothetical protein
MKTKINKVTQNKHGKLCSKRKSKGQYDMGTQNPVKLSAFSLCMFTKINYKLVMYVFTLFKI